VFIHIHLYSYSLSTSILYQDTDAGSPGADAAPATVPLAAVPHPTAVSGGAALQARGYHAHRPRRPLERRPRGQPPHPPL